MQDESSDALVVEVPDDEREELIIHPLKRLMMVIFSPKLVFESVAAKSTRWDWIIPLCLSIAVTLGIVNIGYDYIRSDQFESATSRIEKNTRLTDEQKTAQIEQMKKYSENMSGFARIMVIVSVVVGAFVGFAVIALVMRAVAAFMLHGRMSFRDAFTVCALGSVVTVVGAVIKVPLIFYMESFAQAKLSIGFLLPEDMQESFIVKLLDFDLFTLWYLVIISIGMAVFVKTSLKKTLVPMAVLWIAYRIATQVITGLMGGLGS